MPLGNIGGNRKRAAEKDLESGRVFLDNEEARVWGRDPPRAEFPDVSGGIAMPEPPDWTVFNARALRSPWRTPEFSPMSTMYLMNREVSRFLRTLLMDEGGETLGGRIVKAATTLSAQVQRFLDPEQTKFEGKPSPDGSNLFSSNPDDPDGPPINGSTDLSAAYVFYTTWLAALHLDSLIRVQVAEDGFTKTLDKTNMDYFKGCNPFHARPLWHVEGNEASMRTFERKGDPFDILPHRSSISTPRHPFQWVRRWRQWLVDAADEVYAIATWRWAKSKSAQDAEEAVKHVYAQLPPAAVVLMTLIETENKFEEALCMNHVEDVVIDKRLIIFSETQATTLRDRDRVMDEIIVHENELRASLAPVSRAFRKSFNYRTLRDWGYGRAWAKLFLMLPAEMREVAAQINESFDPQHGKLCYDLFDVHPKIREDIGMDDACHACSEDYEDGQMMMLLHCKHHMHPACAFGSWDEPHKFQFLCPVCRSNPLTWREKVTFDNTRVDEDWMKEDGGHDRDMLVYNELRGAEEREIPQRWPEEMWDQNRYHAMMIELFDQEREDRGLNRFGPLPFGGGVETAAMREQAENEAKAKEAERRRREGITEQDAVSRNREKLKQRLLEQNPQYAAERAKAIRLQEEQGREYEVVETANGPTLQRFAAGAQMEVDQAEADAERQASRSPTQDRPQQTKMTTTPPPITIGQAVSREQAIQRRVNRARRTAELRRQAAVRRDAERAERVAQGLRATPDPETDDEGTGGMDVGTGFIIENNEEEEEEDEDYEMGG